MSCDIKNKKEARKINKLSRHHGSVLDWSINQNREIVEIEISPFMLKNKKCETSAVMMKTKHQNLILPLSELKAFTGKVLKRCIL